MTEDDRLPLVPVCGLEDLFRTPHSPHHKTIRLRVMNWTVLKSCDSSDVPFNSPPLHIFHYLRWHLITFQSDGGVLFTPEVAKITSEKSSDPLGASFFSRHHVGRHHPRCHVPLQARPGG